MRRRTMDLKLVAPDSERAGSVSCASSPFSRAMVAATKPPDPGDTGLAGSAALAPPLIGGVRGSAEPAPDCSAGGDGVAAAAAVFWASAVFRLF